MLPIDPVKKKREQLPGQEHRYDADLRLSGVRISILILRETENSRVSYFRW